MTLVSTCFVIVLVMTRAGGTLAANIGPLDNYKWGRGQVSYNLTSDDTLIHMAISLQQVLTWAKVCQNSAVLIKELTSHVPM